MVQVGAYQQTVGYVDKAKEQTLSKGTKEFSVLFSSEELEKMASDEKYLNEKMRGIEGTVRMSDEINRKYGFERAFGKEGAADTAITKIGISLPNWRNQAQNKGNALKKPGKKNVPRRNLKKSIPEKSFKAM